VDTGGPVKYWNPLPGAPEVRNRCIHVFASDGGFEELLNMLETRMAGRWLGAEMSRVLLQASMDARSTVQDDALAHKICTCIMDPLTNRLTEEDLKVRACCACVWYLSTACLAGQDKAAPERLCALLMHQNAYETLTQGAPPLPP
jgi:hypothetical protein